MGPSAIIRRMQDRNGKNKRVNSGRVDHSEQQDCLINIELDLAITFCQAGLAMRDRTHVERSAADARKALDTVEKMAPTMRLTEKAKEQISEKFVWATILLSQLERHLENV